MNPALLERSGEFGGGGAARGVAPDAADAALQVRGELLDGLGDERREVRGLGALGVQLGGVQGQDRNRRGQVPRELQVGQRAASCGGHQEQRRGPAARAQGGEPGG